MICAKPIKTFFYCHRCANIEEHKPTDELVYPQIEPVSGDCQDYEEANNGND